MNLFKPAHLTRTPTSTILLLLLAKPRPASINPRQQLAHPLSSYLGTRQQNYYKGMMTDSKLPKTEEEWRLKLDPEQFRILRKKGTEMAGTGEYNKHQPDHGIYECAGCAAPLYRYDHKFESGCGWPAFFDAFPGAVSRHEDRSFGRVRTEITCTNCGGHLGHVFKGEGYGHPTDERHCVNSISIKFNESKPADDKMNPKY
ncbi:methionine-R-sulfoxide reductase [Puccinia triticina 1-1 BBBD Race 1]|uniref:Peptide-methionine (R)-S-oxide reductase n=1 Tax=Puccinia triticina (isolate 1-1 / race 1 (BBBD)) TaxID=630390 RepID=A0A0C4F4B0_PUCT1|nr:methionine-R-sulfoxide reductase [Puccinia triticina 1-1 BBBD Race 1]